ncbi:MAG: betaine/proline/choline family ABC transporter ATP-binding protein [Desulfosarcinaceae bacterium]|nr:betaine/proline/choline family ABC transporter ATP-binding protein [Desulfosarcinaceae bacterium]
MHLNDNPSNSGNRETATPPIECQHLWKIFGEVTPDQLKEIQSGTLSKAQVQERFGCVVGVADASFQVYPSEIFCVMGLSGSGKSTLIRHINRLIEPTAGRLSVYGKDILELDPQQLRDLRSSKIGMVFQNMALMPHRSVVGNVAFGLELRKMDKRRRVERAREVLQMVDLADWGDAYPEELSGGMQQRVGLARALASDPDILLMDEPFSALDPLIRRQLQDYFLDLSKITKKTTVFITHDLDEAIRLGSRIAIMKDGALIQIGAPDQIITQPADAYVADFVSGISRLKLIYAHSIYQRPEEVSSELEYQIDDLPSADADANLDQLVDLLVEHNKPIKVVEDGRTIGVITRRRLLQSIQGKETKES